MAEEGGFSYALVIVTRLLTILLLCIFIYTAYQGAMFIKDLRDTASNRMDNGEFPLPLGGLVGELAGTQLRNSIAVDPSLQPTLDQILRAYAEGDYTAVRRELSHLDVLLAERGMTEAQAVNQQLMSAIDRGDSEQMQALSVQLVEMLRE